MDTSRFSQQNQQHIQRIEQQVAQFKRDVNKIQTNLSAVIKQTRENKKAIDEFVKKYEHHIREKSSS